MTEVRQQGDAPDTDRVWGLAHDFVEELNTTLSAVFSPSRVLLHAVLDQSKVVIWPTDPGYIEITVNGQSAFNLDLSYDLALSSDQRYLRVRRSSFKVTVIHNGLVQLLFSYDHVRDAGSKIPSSHVNIHLPNDSMLTALKVSGDRNRPKMRRKKGHGPDGHGLEGEVHFPLGGDRFRPCLEDVLEMLILEFGIDCEEGSRSAIRDGRMRWRERQLRAALSDHLPAVIAEMRDLGFQVTGAAERAVPEPRTDVLRRL